MISERVVANALAESWLSRADPLVDLLDTDPELCFLDHSEESSNLGQRLVSAREAAPIRALRLT